MEESEYCADAEFSAIEVCEVSVVLPSKNQMAISLPRKTPAARLRDKLSNILKVPQGRILILEGHSELYIGVEMTAEAFVELHPKIEVKVKPETLPTKLKPQHLLVNSDTSLSRLTELLTTSEEETLDQLWDWVLNMQCDNEEVVRKLENVRECQGELFSMNSPSELLKATYPLIVLLKMLLPKGEVASRGYFHSFVSQNGYQVIEKIFFKSLQSRRKTRLTMKVILSCTQLIILFLQHDVTQRPYLWSKITDLINWTTTHCTSEDIVDAYLSKEDKAELISSCVHIHLLLTAASYEQFAPSIASPEYLALLKPRTLFTDA